MARMVADWFLQGKRRERSDIRMSRSIRIFTEGNEGNEDLFQVHITRFVLLVIFCSNFRIRAAIGIRSLSSVSSATLRKIDAGVDLGSQSALIRVISGKFISSVASCKIRSRPILSQRSQSANRSSQRKTWGLVAEYLPRECRSRVTPMQRSVTSCRPL